MSHDGNEPDRAAKNESLFREVNERVAALHERFGAGVSDHDGFGFVCECADPSCTDSITMSLAEYERVRSDPAAFVIVSGHQQEEVERVVSLHDGYAVVRKIGRAGALATADDPRNA